MQTLVFLAGKKALSMIRDEGLNPEQVQVVAAAAGGPKWLVLYGLDRYLFGRFFKERRDPLHLIGSSIGAWQFAAASVKDPEAAFDNFKEAYIQQRYSARPTPGDVSEEGQRVLESYIGDDEIRQILAHPSFRPAILTVRCLRPALAGGGRPAKFARGPARMRKNRQSPPGNPGRPARKTGKQKETDR